VSPYAETADGARLWYETAGEGPRVVFVHPGLWDSRTWDRQFESFPAAGWMALRADVRGYGRSDRPGETPYSVVRDMVAVMDAAGVGSAAVVGCSMGGAIALDLALSHPDRVDALVLVASGMGGYEETEDEEAWWESHGSGIEEAVEAGDLERAQDLRLRIWAPLGTEDPAGRRIREIAFDNLHELTMDESAAEELDPPAIGRLGEIACPVLVLPADHDPPDMRSVSRRLAEGIPGAVIVDIPDVDHVVNMRAPEAFDRTVLGFLESVRGRPSGDGPG
jgi:pimeloyl-ACP methyl ester carboxylesterase